MTLIQRDLMAALVVAMEVVTGDQIWSVESACFPDEWM